MNVPRHDVLVDVMVPHYGSSDLLAEALASVVGQTDPGWRLTVVDDSDSPEVAAVVRGLATDRATYVANPVRLGVAGNFQRCLDLASADWVVLMGYDDRLLPDYVSHLRASAQRHPHVGAVMPAVRVIAADGSPTATTTDRVKQLLRTASGRREVRAGQRLMTTLLHGNWTYFPATAWRRDVVAGLGFRQDLPTTLDLALLADVVLAGHAVAVTSSTDFEYRRHARSASSLTAATAERFREESRLLDELERRCRALGWDRASRAARLRVTSRLHSAMLAPAAFRQGRAGVGRSLLRHGLGGRP